MNVISKKFHEIILNYQQRKVTRMYQSEGLTDNVLEKQSKISKKRQQLNLPERYEMIYKRYLQ